MRCTTVREAISAGVDGAEHPLAAEQLAAHLAECASCRQWRELAHVVTRRTRLGGPVPPPDLAARLIGGVQDDARRRRTRAHWLLVARVVVCAGILQLLATVPLLLLARSRTPGAGRVGVLGLVELAIGAGFFVGAVVVLWRERDDSVLRLLPSPRPSDQAKLDDVNEVA
jgi:predicted anti-sigma-YlaC factor YlaD